MTIKNLVKVIVDSEGKKSHVKVGDVREIAGILSDYFFALSHTEGCVEKLTKALISNGKRRNGKKVKI